MLTLLKELNILKCIDGRKTRNGNLFKRVSEQMREGIFVRTAEQIRIRWKLLKKMYYDSKKNNGTGGHNQVTCLFGEVLEEPLGSRSTWPYERNTNVSMNTHKATHKHTDANSILANSPVCVVNYGLKNKGRPAFPIDKVFVAIAWQ